MVELHDLDQLLHSSELFDTTLKDEVLELHEGERREVATLFADIKGFTAMSEYLDPEDVRMILDRLLQLFAHCITQYGGYVDKYEGDLVMALFGAKVASERDTERAIHAALAMLDKLEQFNALLAKKPELRGVQLGVRIGINTGLVTTGRIAEKREGDFTVYGDAVNLASRMESSAPVNRIMLPEATMRSVSDVFEFEDYGEIEVKGKSDLVSVFLVKGLKARQAQRWSHRQTVYVGRQSELAALQQAYQAVAQHIQQAEVACQKVACQPILVGIKGAAGMGKSRLLYEFLAARRQPRFVLQAATPHVIQNPYCVFTTLIKQYLNISHFDAPQVVKRKLETGFKTLEAYLPDSEELQTLRDIRPLIGFLIGVKYPDVRLESSNHEALQPHLQAAIRHFLEAVALEANQANAPLLIALEDLQWLDEASQSALTFLLQTLNLEEKRASKRLKHLLFLLTYRPAYHVPEAVKQATDFRELELVPLDNNDAITLLQAIIGNLPLSPALKRQLMKKSEGNPFYLEEWGNLIQHLDVAFSDSEYFDLPIPNSLNKLVLSRIDQLEDEVKLLLQKAAVIGKEFLVDILTEIEKKLHRSDDIVRYLRQLEDNDFIHQMLDSKYSAYFFKHAITQEVAYNMLLKANRKILHQITAEVIEERFTGQLEEFYYDLAEHYSKAELPEKAVEYLEKAGNKAKEHYQNELTIKFYDRLLPLLKKVSWSQREREKKRVDVLLKKGNVFQLIGRWPDTETLFTEALALSEQLQDQSRIANALGYLGWLHNLKGDHAAALSCYTRKLKIAEALGDRQGIATALGNIGNVHADTGQYDAAMKYYQQKLAISEDMGDQRGISIALWDIGNIHADTGNYDQALECYQQKLAISQKLRDKRGVSISLGNIGDIYAYRGEYAKAMDCYRKDLIISEELGDKRGIAITAGNMGDLYMYTGNYARARECYQKDLTISQELQDKRGLEKAFGNIGDVYEHQGHYAKAMRCYQRQWRICKSIGHKKGIAQVLGKMGRIHGYKGNNERAMHYHQQALALAEELGDQRGISEAAWNIGKIHANLGNYDEALTWYRKRLSVSDELGDKRARSIALGKIGDIYMYRGAYQEAMSYYRQDAALAKELGDQRGLAIAAGNLGRIYTYTGDYARALRYYNKDLTYSKKLGDKIGMAKATGNIGIVYQHKGEYDLAMAHYQKQLTLCRELGYKKGIAAAIGNMGVVAYARGDYATALQQYQEQLRLVEEIGHQGGIAEALANLGQLYARQNDATAALSAYDRAINIGRTLGAKYALCRYLIEKAKVLFARQAFDKAQTLNAEGLRLAVEVARQDYQFEGRVLAARLDFVLRNRDKAITTLNEMLEQTEDAAEKNELHRVLYHLYRELYQQ